MLKKLYKNSESENNQKKRKLRQGCSKAKKKKEKKSKNLQAQFFSSQINLEVSFITDTAISTLLKEGVKLYYALSKNHKFS